MQHLSPERIAALADEPATLVERTHLSSCASCTAELVAAQRLVRLALTETPTIERPLTSWERLAPALDREGLLVTKLGAGDASVAHPGAVVHALPSRPNGGMRYRQWMQVAAGAFLAIGGGVLGRASASLPAAAAGGAALATSPDTAFASTDEAVAVLQAASAQYQRAVAYIAANDSTVTLRGRDAADLYLARLDALDRAVAATRSALFRVPEDPVLNSYYLQSVAARDLTLRQLGDVVPVSSSTRTRF